MSDDVYENSFYHCADSIVSCTFNDLLETLCFGVCEAASIPCIEALHCKHIISGAKDSHIQIFMFTTHFEEDKDF